MSAAATYLNFNQVTTLIDEMSDEDFDFFTNLLLDTVFSSVESIVFPNNKTKQTVINHLNSKRFDLQVALGPKEEPLWLEVYTDLIPDNDNYSDNSLSADIKPATNAAAQIALNTANYAQIQADLLSQTSAGIHAGESLKVASILVTVRAPFVNFTPEHVCNLNIMWLPEQELKA